MDILDTIGPLSVDDFMRRHWQRAPLLARGAFPRFASPIEPVALFALASRDPFLKHPDHRILKETLLAKWHGRLDLARTG